MLSPQNSGKPPKNATQIHASLQALHRGECEQPSAGDLSAGFQPHDQLILETFHNRENARGLQTELRSHGIWSDLKKSRGQTQILIDGQDRDQARWVLTEFVATHSDEIDARRAARFDWTIFGALIGATLGLMMLMFIYRQPLDVLLIGSFGFAGGLLGHSLDRLLIFAGAGHWRRISVWEFLLLTALPALAISMIRLTWIFLARLGET